MSVKTIKFSKHTQHPTIYLNNTEYRGYTVGNLPRRFAFIYNEDKDQEGMRHWFNYKGLTYVERKKSFWADIAAQNYKDNIELLFKVMK